MAYQFKPVFVCADCWAVHAVWEIRQVGGKTVPGWWFTRSTYWSEDLDGSQAEAIMATYATRCVGPCCPDCGAEPVVLRRARARFTAPSFWNLWQPSVIVIREGIGEGRQGAMSVVPEAQAPKENKG